MKSPRRAKKARKPAPKKKLTKRERYWRSIRASAKRQAKARAEGQRKIDPFHLPERLIPAGWGYQWKVKGEPVPPGWHAVPFSRHAHDFPRSAQYQGSIVIKGLILMEALKDQIVSEQHALQQLAIDWAKDREIAMGVTFDRGTGFPMMDPDEIVTKVLRDAPPDTGPDIDVPISLLVRVPAKYAAAAAYLNLTLAEYTRRRIVMQHVVLATFTHEGQEPVYQPVNLHFTPYHKESNV